MRLGLGLGLNRIALEFTFGLSEDGSSYTLSGYSGDPVTFTIGGNDYLVDPDNIVASAPVVIPSQDYSNADEDVSGDLSTGDTITVTLPAVAFDPDGGVPVITWVLKNATGTLATDTTTYVKTGTDYIEAYGMDIEITATNGYGTTVEELAVIEAPAFVPDSIAFTGTGTSGEYLDKTDGAGSGADANTMLFSTMFEWTAESASGVFEVVANTDRMSGGWGPWYGFDIYKDSANMKMFLYDQAENPVLNFETIFDGVSSLVAGDKVTILLTVDDVGTFGVNDYREWQVAVLVNGTLTYSRVGARAGEEFNATPDKIKLSTGLRISGPANFYDMRLWTDITIPDVTSSAVYREFVDASGDQVNPARPNILYGTPTLWMPTDETDANALTNLGSGTDFTSKGTAWT